MTVTGHLSAGKRGDYRVTVTASFKILKKPSHILSLGPRIALSHLGDILTITMSHSGITKQKFLPPPCGVEVFGGAEGQGLVPSFLTPFVHQ